MRGFAAVCGSARMTLATERSGRSCVSMKGVILSSLLVEGIGVQKILSP